MHNGQAKQKGMSSSLADLLGIKHSVLMAPMFLVSNTQMIKEALEAGITASFPALNYRTEKELRDAIIDIQNATDKPFGVNLIVNKSNPSYKQQLKILIDLKVAYIITSLGNPKEVIERCKPLGIKVFCDVVDLKYAQKVEALGADALIAVNSLAGGHSGKMDVETLIPLLKKHSKLPIISAGGIVNKEQYESVMALGASGVSVGTAFIASTACTVSEAYKQALIDYRAEDVVKTDKMSGTPLTVINTPYVQQINNKFSLLNSLLKRNKSIKKIVKMVILLKGKKLMEKSAFRATYKTVWVAGPALEYITEIKTVKEIIDSIVAGEANELRNVS